MRLFDKEVSMRTQRHKETLHFRSISSGHQRYLLKNGLVPKGLGLETEVQGNEILTASVIRRKFSPQ